MSDQATSQAPTTAPKRRVRTGCLTCRRRRRKCDETRPTCDNCKGKKLQCRWGYNVTFINAETGERDRLDEPEVVREDEASTVKAKPTTTTASTGRRQPSSRVDDVLVSPSFERPAPVHQSSYQLPQPVRHPPARSTDIQRWTSNISPQADNAVYPLARASSYQGSNASTTRHTVSTPNLISGVKQQDEIDLLIHYRYNVAPNLDLGVGSLWFGIQLPLRAVDCEGLSYAIMALAATHRAQGSQPNEEGVADVASHYRQLAESLKHMNIAEDYTASIVLLAWQRLLESPPETWLRLAQGMMADINAAGGYINTELWRLLARVVISSTLLSPSSSPSLHLPSPGAPHNLQVWTGTFSQSSTEQLGQSLQLLHRSLNFLPSRLEKHRKTRFPLLSAWQSCWSDTQIWYAVRTQEMHPILEIPITEAGVLPGQGSDFAPAVVFSNSSSLLSNITHHLTCILLLQNKPRLARPVAETESSISPIWHALRIIGIVANASEMAAWDPAVVAAIVVAGQMFSHDTQKAFAADLLRRCSRSTGMRLLSQIQKLDPTSPV